jgi:phenylalanine-4-hydroxylase
LLTLNDGIEFIDHPSFADKEYRLRREQIALASKNYKMSDRSLPIIDYNENEKKVWKIIYRDLTTTHKTHACEEYNWTID